MSRRGHRRVRLAWPGAGVSAVLALTLGLATHQPLWAVAVVSGVMAALGWVFIYFWQVDDSLGIRDLRLGVATSVAVVLVSAVPAVVLLADRTTS